MNKKKVSIIVLIIGIAMFITAPILGCTLDKLELVNRKPITINEDSEFGLQEAYAYPVSISKDQTLVIEFSVYYANVTATLKIFGKGIYDQEYPQNSTPDSVTGQYFIYSEFAWGQHIPSSISSDNSVEITNNGYYYIEFAGAVSNNFLVSLPGKYVIVVYGDNTGPPVDTAVRFNLVVKIDGPGEFLEDLFYYIGTGVMVCLVLFISYGYYKKRRRGK